MLKLTTKTLQDNLGCVLYSSHSKEIFNGVVIILDKLYDTKFKFEPSSILNPNTSRSTEFELVYYFPSSLSPTILSLNWNWQRLRLEPCSSFYCYSKIYHKISTLYPPSVHNCLNCDHIYYVLPIMHKSNTLSHFSSLEKMAVDVAQNNAAHGGSFVKQNGTKRKAAITVHNQFLL